MNYDELISELRFCNKGNCGGCPLQRDRQKCHSLLSRASDAIDELQKTVKVYQQFLIFVGAEFLFVPKKEAELQAERNAKDVNRKQTEMIKACLPSEWGKL